MVTSVRTGLPLPRAASPRGPNRGTVLPLQASSSSSRPRNHGGWAPTSTVHPHRNGAVRNMAKHVIVIGAGVVGLACAWRLRRRGHRVTLLDPSPASGASHAAAGMLAAVSEYYFEEESLLALSLPASRLYPQIIAELARRTGGPTGFRDIPTIVATADSADRERLEHLGDQQRSIGLTVTALTPSKAREMESFFSPRISGAFLAEDDRQVNPRVLAGAYLSDLEADEGCDVRPLAATELLWRDGAVVGVRAAAVPGAEVFTHRFDERAVDTDEMTGDAPSWSSEDLPAGDSIDIAADLVVVANGLLSPTLAGLPEGLEWPIRPVYGDVIRLRTPEHLRPLLTRTVRGLVHGRSVYIVPREDGTIVIGATEREDGRDAVLGGRSAATAARRPGPGARGRGARTRGGHGTSPPRHPRQRADPGADRPRAHRRYRHLSPRHPAQRADRRGGR
ncbi:FAD-dependent oxidoreductase [Propionibacterium freudenreichii]|nr:FAD-dependent oxidoreductase [Propionibacterium freudenreichii]